MHGEPLDSEQLLTLAASGHADAVDQLLSRYRARLKRLVSLRIDPRVSKRIDPSDIVQETLILAARRLNDYIRDRPLPLYPWIRQLAIEQIIQHHRHHIHVQARSVDREAPLDAGVSDESMLELSEILLCEATSLSKEIARREMHESIHVALAQLKEKDREILVLRFLEQLSIEEIAEILNESADAVKSRQRRAVERFSQCFKRDKA